MAPLAKGLGIRTPALIAWGHDASLAYSIWERVEGEPIDERHDPEVWREVGRLLQPLHQIDHCPDPRRLLDKPQKRDARPHLHLLDPGRARWFERWLDLCDRAPPLPPRLVHNDIQGMNVMVGPQPPALIDWADAAWADPANDFGSMFMPDVPSALAGYEERGTLGPGAEGRILRAVIGHAVRKAVRGGWATPMNELLRFVEGDVPERWLDWMPRR